jgi:hypothetical protein
MIVSIDDSYDIVGDRLKTSRMAACNDCADMRDLRDKLEGLVERNVSQLIVAALTHKPLKPEEMAKIEDTLISVTKRYTQLIAKWHKSRIPWWDEAIVQSILEKPQHWHKFLAQCWKTYETKQIKELC